MMISHYHNHAKRLEIYWHNIFLAIRKVPYDFGIDYMT